MDSAFVVACGAGTADESPRSQFDAIVVWPPGPDADAGAFGRDPGPMAAESFDTKAAAATRAAPQQATWRCNPAAAEAAAAFAAFDLEQAAARHRACCIDTMIQALDDKWR